MPTLNLGDTHIHYAHAGSDGTALVFVHGALCDHADWRFQLDHFAARHRVLAPDLHGHGLSARTSGRIRVASFAQDVVALCQSQQLRRVVLVGHSMGCRVLLQIWRTTPELVAGLVLVDGAYLVPGLLGTLGVDDRAALAHDAGRRAADAHKDVEPSVRARQGFAQMFFDPQFDRLRDAIVQRAAALPAHVARELMPDFAAWDVLHMEEVLATITVPMLVIACTHMNSQRERVSLAPDTVTPWLQAVASLAPHAQILRRHGAGHFPMLEHPEDTNLAIDAFLQCHQLAA